jgi:hypothetical protein
MQLPVTIPRSRVAAVTGLLRFGSIPRDNSTVGNSGRIATIETINSQHKSSEFLLYSKALFLPDAITKPAFHSEQGPSCMSAQKSNTRLATNKQY